MVLYFQVLSEGDEVQFEAVPQDSNDNSYYCSWFASLVHRGGRPGALETVAGLTAVSPQLHSTQSGRRGSIGSTGSSESSNTESSSDSLGSPLISREAALLPPAPVEQVRWYLAFMINDVFSPMLGPVNLIVSSYE